MDDDRTRDVGEGGEPPAADDAFEFLTAPFDPEPVEAEASEPLVAAPTLAAVPELEEEPAPEPEAAETSARPFAVVLPEREVAEPDAEPEPEPEPELATVAVQRDAEPWADAEREAEAEPEKIPWYKREIGRSGAKAPGSDSSAARPRPQRRLRPEPEAPVEEPPVLKREVSLKRKRDDAAAAERVPFYKREISFGRKREGAEAVAAPPPEAAAPVDDTPRVPFYKREISLGRKKEDATGRVAAPPEERATRRRDARLRRGERVAPSAVAADEEPTAEQKPRLKRELTFRRRAEAVHDGTAAVTTKKAKEKKAKPERARRELSLPKLERKAKSRKEGGAAKRQKKLVGLKIGASQLAAAQVVNNGHAELVKVARESLVDGVVAGGELRDPEALTEALREFFKKHKLPRRGVRLGIANNRIGVRTFELTGIDDPKQLANAIRFRAQEALPIPIEEAVIDWRVLSETTDEEGQLTRRILLVVAYRELVDRYVAACRKAGIQLVGIDLEAFALLRALGDGEKRAADDGALVAVSVGHERSTFAVSDGEVCEFTRVLEWGGNSLNVAIARALDRAPSEVEELKRMLALDASPDAAVAELPEGVDEDAVAKAREAVRRQLQTFARELVSSLQFYQNQPGSLGIGEVILTGGTAQMPGLERELERLIGVRVRVGDPLRRVRASRGIADDGLGSLSVAIGLGIED